MIYGRDMIKINVQVKESGINQLMAAILFYINQSSNGSHLVLYLPSSGKMIYGLDMIEINAQVKKSGINQLMAAILFYTFPLVAK